MAFMHDRQLGFPRNAFWVVVVLAMSPLGKASEIWAMAVRTARVAQRETVPARP